MTRETGAPDPPARPRDDGSPGDARGLERVRLVVFDADGTLRRTTVPGRPCPNGPDDWELLDGVAERIASLRALRPDLRFGIASNQGGVGMGYLREAMARRLLEDLARAAFGESLAPEAIELCPHAPRSGCKCRKPEPRMLERIAAFYGVEPGAALYVGDMEGDRDAAERAGFGFAWADDFFEASDDG